MKLRILSYSSTLILAVIAAISVNVIPKKELPLISFTNVEALANTTNETLICWLDVKGGGDYSTHKTYCGDCKAILCSNWWNESHCSS
ncbi:MAG: hypothetical protein ACOCWM_01210 [Cyclobacteriaceae bacterium]